MSGRDEQIYQEACALWQALYDEAPPAQVDGGTLLDAIMGRLPDRDYDRLRSVHLRPANITGPAPQA